MARQSARLGRGELSPSGPNAIARAAYLEALRRLVPDCLSSLEKIAHEHFAGTDDGEKAFYITEWRIGDMILPVELRHEAKAVSPGTEDGERALAAWCDRWGLTPTAAGSIDWCRNVGRATARYLARKKPDEPVTWAAVTAWYWAPVIQPPTWEPHRETEAGFRARVDDYIQSVREIATAAAWKPTPEKRSPDHFSWLVRYQAEGWTLERIAQYHQVEKGYPDVPAISKALKSTAALVGLRLRRPRGGRARR